MEGTRFTPNCFLGRGVGTVFIKGSSLPLNNESKAAILHGRSF